MRIPKKEKRQVTVVNCLCCGAAGNRTRVLRHFILSSTGVVLITVRFAFPEDGVRLLGTVYLIVLAHEVQTVLCALLSLLYLMPRTL